jgi:hypothetical protein
LIPFVVFPWILSFASNLTTIISSYRLDNKIKSLSGICFQPNIYVTGIIPNFKYMLFSATGLYVIKFILVLINWLHFKSKQARLNNDEILQDIV